MKTYTPYNPLDKEHLGESVADAMLRSAVYPMSALDTFLGAGIYAIYYHGDFPAYAQISQQNDDGHFALPIYVGKAVPAGARKGLVNSPQEQGNSLFKRLKEHADTVKVADNLDIEDFSCRFLVVDDIWIPLGESLLISRFSPLWNQVIDGFGNHTPGKGRFNQKRSRWDVMHPGREWAAKCAERPESQADLIREVANHLANSHE